MNRKKRLLIVILFAIAMAWMESATVAYLRTLVNRLEPYQLSPLPLSAAFGATELIREAATLVMLFTVGWLAGKSWRSRFGYFMVAFGVWDIFYYVFLKVIVGWPHSLFDWDVLFLLPLPWWGPVLSPILISLILIAGGILLARSDEIDSHFKPASFSWLLCLVGAVIALYVFMADSIHALGKNAEAIQNLLPTDFNWLFFIVALTLMTAPMIDISFQLWKQKGKNGRSDITV